MQFGLRRDGESLIFMTSREPKVVQIGLRPWVLDQLTGVNEILVNIGCYKP